ncbi:MAG: hypothetical protein QF410_05475, partial [Planctomycetota bacterium]|nr:hypothetical protein [Planctomycetota bacterium]
RTSAGERGAGSRDGPRRSARATRCNSTGGTAREGLRQDTEALRDARDRRAYGLARHCRSNSIQARRYCSEVMWLSSVSEVSNPSPSSRP